jgi:hypothetical protein
MYIYIVTLYALYFPILHTSMIYKSSVIKNKFFMEFDPQR